MAVISVPEKKEAGLSAVKGWLKEDDAFFKRDGQDYGGAPFKRIQGSKGAERLICPSLTPI